MKRNGLFFLICLAASSSDLQAKSTPPRTTFVPQVQHAEKLLQTSQQEPRKVKVTKKKTPKPKPSVEQEKIKVSEVDNRSFVSKFFSPTPRKIKIARRQAERAKRRVRQEKEAAERALRQKKMTDMTVDELEKLMAQFEKSERLDLVIKCLDQLVKICEDKHKLEKYLLQLADLLRKRNYLEKAGKIYKQFADLYPGSKNIEYVEYQAISCHYAETLTHDRDQTMTEETLKLADKFLGRDIYKTYREEVEEIRHSCYKKLFEHEVDVFEFYARNGILVAAQGRLREMRDRFLPKMPEVKQRLVSFERNLQDQASSRNLMLATTIDIDDVVVQEMKPAVQTVVQANQNKKRAKNRF